MYASSFPRAASFAGPFCVGHSSTFMSTTETSAVTRSMRPPPTDEIEIPDVEEAGSRAVGSSSGGTSSGGDGSKVGKPYFGSPQPSPGRPSQAKFPCHEDDKSSKLPPAAAMLLAPRRRCSALPLKPSNVKDVPLSPLPRPMQQRALSSYAY
jgi:hypothetical protein